MILAAAAPIAGLPSFTQTVVIGVVALAAVLLATIGSTRAPGFLAALAATIVAAAIAVAAVWLATESVADGIFPAVLVVGLAAAANLFTLARPGEVWGWGLLVFAAIIGAGLVSSMEVAAFLAFAGLCLFGALKVVLVDEVVHATIWLAGVLFGVAGLFIALGMPFLAMIQVLVYVGAVITLILFTVMLTIPRKEDVTLEGLELPPGVTIESVEDLDPETPRYGHGPMKDFEGTNPRKPVAPPATLYGVSITDNTYGTDQTVRRKAQKEKGAP